MIQGLCAAYQATGNATHLAAARNAARFIETHLTRPDHGLYRTWKDGVTKVHGFLDDYAFFANALVDLYESCFERSYLTRAIELADLILAQFWDDGLCFTPKDSPPLVHRPRSPYDTAWPSGTSTTVFALLRLHELTGKPLFRERAGEVIRSFGGAAAKHPFEFAHLLAAVDFRERGPLSIVLDGDKPKAGPFVEAIHRAYLPARVLAFAEDVPMIGTERHTAPGQVAAYVCRRQVCGLPITTVPELIQNLTLP
jgi:uncharacterized protein YyaL (SSP411 family)